MTTQSLDHPGGEQPGDVPAPETVRTSQAEARYAILAIATEWSSIHGGLSTFNRQLCCALAAAGARVVCVVLKATSEERTDADHNGVVLAEASKVKGFSEMFALAAKPTLPEGFAPNIVIGHGRVTGPIAERLRDEHFSAAKRLHFIHMAPDEIEWEKLDRADDAGVRAEERTELELSLARTADLVVAVGPHLHHRLQNDLEPDDIDPFRLDPGFDAEDFVGSRRVPAGLCRILLFGGLEDEYQKGLDLAAQAVGLAVKRQEDGFEEIEFVVRGAEPGSTDNLRNRIRVLSGLPSLAVVVRPYSTDVQRLTADLRRASVVLMPSRTEGFGLVGVEAIVAGTPVLISRSSGLGALLREVLPPPDAGRVVVNMSGNDQEVTDRWARAIESVLRDRDAAFRRAAEARRHLSEHKKWSTSVRALLGALDLPTGEGQPPERAGSRPGPPPPRVGPDGAPVAREPAGDPRRHPASLPDHETVTRALNERRLRALDKALRQIEPGIYRNAKRRVTRLAAAKTCLLSVDPIVEALSAAVEAEREQPALQRLQELEFILQQHYTAVSRQLSALEQLRSVKDAMQPCQDLAVETAGLIAACTQAIRRVT